jgi:hypothetical protein
MAPQSSLPLVILPREARTDQSFFSATLQAFFVGAENRLTSSTRGMELAYG